MDESKMTNYLLFGIVILMLCTYLFTVKINLGKDVNLDTQIMAAIGA